MSRVALGFKARTGRAILVILAAGEHGPQVFERSEVALLPEGEFAPYHAAEDLEPLAARQHVKRSIRSAAARVLVGPGMPDWSTDEILAVHFRMHKAEGELFRDVLVQGARECGIALTTPPQKSALDAAAKLLGATRARLDAELAALGKSAGAPWGAHQKEAAAAALVVLNGRR